MSELKTPVHVIRSEQLFPNAAPLLLLPDGGLQVGRARFDAADLHAALVAARDAMRERIRAWPVDMQRDAVEGAAVICLADRVPAILPGALEATNLLAHIIGALVWGAATDE